MTSHLTEGHTLQGVHVERWGTGTPVVLVHGGGHGDPGGGALKWRFQRPLAEQGWELIVSDRPGMGQSPSQGPDDFELDGPWVAELLGDGAHLIGHSYGGAIATCASGLRPEAVRSFTLIEAPLFSVARDRPEARALVARLEGAMSERIPLVGVVKAFKVLGIPRDRELRERPPVSAMRAMAKGFKTMRSPDSFDFGPSIDAVVAAGVPTMWVDGGWSDGLRAVGEEFTKVSGGKLLTIPAGHHFPQMIEGGAPFNTAWQTFAGEL